MQVWFKNRRAKWRKQKREEQERLRKIQDDHTNNTNISMTLTSEEQMDSNESSLQINSSVSNSYSDEESSDLEVE